MDRRDLLASLSGIPCTCAGKVFARNLPSIFLKAREVEKKRLALLRGAQRARVGTHRRRLKRKCTKYTGAF